MNWCCPGSPGLPVTAGWGLATPAAWTIAREVEPGQLLERFTNAGGEGLVYYRGFSHRQLRRHLRGQAQTPGAERRHELLPGGDDFIERE